MLVSLSKKKKKKKKGKYKIFGDCHFVFTFLSVYLRRQFVNIVWYTVEFFFK